MLKPEILFAKSRRFLSSRIILAGLMLFCLFAGIFSPFGISSDSSSEIFLSPIHSFASSEQDESDAFEIIYQNIDDILIWKTENEGASDLQDLIDTSFANDPISGTNQNYITSIIQNPYIDADLSKYITSLGEALDSAVASEEGIFPTSLQKSLATLQICIDYENSKLEPGDDTAFPALSDYVNQTTIDTALNHTIGEKGIMSYIWGLYMLNTCGFYYGKASNHDEVIESLISYQCSDGGYTLSGDVGDVDVTAMAMQVLAPYAPSPFRSAWFPIDSLLVESLSASREFLDTHQLEDGDYESFGTRCSESTAQAALAYASMYTGIFTSLKTDTLIDRGLLEGLLLYKQDDGGFSHTLGLPSNDMASSQVLQALTVMLPDVDNGNVNTPALRHASQIKPLKNSKNDRNLNITLRVLIPIIFSLISIGAGIFLTIKKKKYVHLISAVLIAVLFTGVFFVLDIQSKSNFESRESTVLLSPSDTNASEISFTISAATVSDEEIYPLKTIYVAKDSTVFEILSEVCRTENIQLDYEKNSVYGLAYIKGINSIYEYDHGDLSGWMYRVNGELPNIGCGYYKVSEGDVVEILYSTNIGRDLTDD